jgi:hypothetical protein
LKANLKRIDYQSADITEGVWATVNHVQDLENGKPVNGTRVFPPTRKGGK